MTSRMLKPQDAYAEWLRDTLWYPISRWYLRPAAKALARRLATTRTHPNAVTLSGLCFAAGAAAALLAGESLASPWRLLVAQTLPVALLLCYWAADQVDGHLARLTGKGSNYGSWLDANLDELIDVGIHVAIGWLLCERLDSPVPVGLALAFVAGKYLFMFGLNGREDDDASRVPQAQPRGLLRRLYHLPADADVRLHVLVAAILLDPIVGALWWELAWVAVYYNFRWMARHALVRRRHAGGAIGRDSNDRVIGPLRLRAPSAGRVPPLRELAPLCQKPGHPVRGNWMARKVARPLALYVTRFVLPWGVSANSVTAVAALSGLAAATAFAYGPPYGLVAGATLLQLWYLLDHVDGQVARFHGTASVAGTYVDYLMHYAVHAACPFGLGWGLFAATGEAAWLLAGGTWSAGMVLLGLQHDCLYKAFFRRLRHTDGTHTVHGKADGGAQAATPFPSWRQPVRLASFVMQKACEMHVIMNVLTGLAIAALLQPALGLVLVMLTMALLAGLTPMVAIVRIVRTVTQGRPDREFAAWFPEIDPREIDSHAARWSERASDRSVTEVTTANY